MDMDRSSRTKNGGALAGLGDLPDEYVGLVRGGLLPEIRSGQEVFNPIQALRAAAQIELCQCEAVGIVISGTFVGTLEVQTSNGRVADWATIAVFDLKANCFTYSITAAGSYVAFALGGAGALRVVATAWTSGKAETQFWLTRSQLGQLSRTPSPRTFATSQVATNAATATLVAAARPTRRSVAIQNLGTQVVYVGDSTVTAATGVALDQYRSITFETGAAIYAISSAATPSVAVADEYD